MSDPASHCVLVINGGSSSLKFAVYRIGSTETLLLSGVAERIGLRGGRFLARDVAGQVLLEEHADLPEHDAALKKLLDWLHSRDDGRPEMIGHRVVHGGPNYSQPQLITADLLHSLDELVRLAPEHLPPELKCIRAIQRYYPDLKQVACFDTAFHRQMPELAQRYPLARSLWHEGVLRYGFHGLSYEYIVGKLAIDAAAEVNGRLIVAHLGNGASMTAILGGKSVETTMGLTPAGGLMMGTRSGDLDPGILLYLLQEKGRTPAAIDYLVNARSGLVGVSDISSDMRDLLAQEAREPHAAQAVAMYCYHAKKWLGALAAVLGGIDTLVFTAGVGTYSPVIRARICQGMEFLGLKLDAGRNEANAPIISQDGGPVTVRVIKTDEELVIARHTSRLIES
jgi:acetate kinase